MFTTLLLVALPILGWVQHRWITQLGQAQRAEMDRGLLTSATQLGRVFDGELGRVLTATRAAGSMIRDNEWQPYADRYIAWRETAEYPEAVAHVWLVDIEQGSLRLRQWNEKAFAFEADTLPDELQTWHPHLEQALKSGRLSTPLFGGSRLPHNSSLAFIAVLGRLTGPAQEDSTPALLGFNVVQFNLDFVGNRMFPSLVERYLPTVDGDRYRVAVADERGDSGVLYASDQDTPSGLDQGASIDLLTQSRRPNAQVLVPKWRLYVEHRAGVVEQAVARLTNWNLGVGLGMLALLFGSIVILAASSSRAQRFARQQIEMVASVSHELRTPIAVICAAAENLSEGVTRADRVKYYGNLIDVEARRLEDVVESAMLYAGISAGRSCTTRIPLAPAAIIDAALEATARAIPIPQLSRAIPSDLPQVAGDAAALQSALQNVIANAVKYGGPTGWVGIRAEAVGGRRPEVRITIEDRGPGISSDDLPHIFKPFFRGEAVAHQTRGSGLGLALVRQIISAHRGNVSVSTSSGGGTVFVITLPALDPNSDYARPVADTGGTLPAHGSRWT